MEKQRKNNLPNFLIVGAPKSGSTSLFYYLRQHPDIYLSAVKEPKFITSQFLNIPHQGPKDTELEKLFIPDYQDYLELFSGVKNQKAIGESSVDNLYFYKRAIPLIKKYFGNPKIIIMLRNPVDRAYSHYLHHRRDLVEDLSFEEALEAEKERKENNWYFRWYYSDVGFYYNQVKAYLENFSNIKIFLTDDLKEHPQELLSELFQFLEIDDSFSPDVSFKFNVSGAPEKNKKKKALHYLITKQSRWFEFKLKKIILTKPYFPKERIIKVVEGAKNRNIKKPEMDPETRKQLQALFRDDILKIQELIGRDLGHWLE
ncbi:sulfotransferase [Patescibacteria group bacterium]|nr:sulfotransferase [Patescibacteria group bacterium]MBU1672995.1 sulfotransferase [Patescibacteria group bacterium]MBU1962970.1 sulfotransferase [Patescibacteria group bacterium]